MTTVKVFVFGVPSRTRDGKRVELPAVVFDQLRIANRLRNRLVELDHGRRDQIAAVWSSVPEIAAVEEHAERAEATVVELLARTAQERVAARKSGKTVSSDALAAARRELREVRARRRELIGEARVALKPTLGAIADADRAAVKGTYAEFCQVPDADDRLYYGTYTDVVDHHKVAVKMVGKTRASGKVSELRFHRFDGTGSLAVNLLRQAGQPQRTPELVADATGKYRNVFCLEPWVDPWVWDRMSRPERKAARWGEVRMRVGPGVVTLPVLVHRMIPADADITSAKLVVRRRAHETRAEVHVTARVPDPAGKTGPMVALHLGWRSLPDGVRVAAWRTTDPVAMNNVPWVVQHTDTSGEIIVPAGWMSRLDRVSDVRSERDITLDDIRDQVVDALTDHGAVPRVPDPDPDEPHHWFTANAARKWRAPGRFANLAFVLNDTCPPGLEPLRDALEQWRRGDKKAWIRETGGRRRALANRLDTFRVIAARFAAQVGTVVVDDGSVPARAPDPSQDSAVPSAVATMIARNRASVAPSELRTHVVNAVVGAGGNVVTIDHTGVTRTHADCGHVNPADDRYMTVRVQCDGCNRTYDQDRSATLVMLAKAAAEPDTPSSVRITPDQG